MTNNSLIEKVTKMVADYNEAENIYESSVCIRSRVTDWYNNTDLTDPQQLAALTLTGPYRPISWIDIINITNYFFPEEDEYQYYAHKYHLNTNNISVAEDIDDLCWY